MKICKQLILPLVAAGVFVAAPSAEATFIRQNWHRLKRPSLETAQTTANLIPLDGTWQSIEETTATPFGFPGPWTWNSSDPVRLHVTDFLSVGHIFEVYDNGQLLGRTSNFDPNQLGAYALTPEEGYWDPAFSHGSWVLPAGAHAIIFNTIERPPILRNSTSSVGFMAVRQPVPVPEGGGTVVLLGAALAGMAGFSATRVLRRARTPALG